MCSTMSRQGYAYTKNVIINNNNSNLIKTSSEDPLCAQ
jgi:DNA-binding winged helix-turn-helix (wHTH) protein